LLTNKAAIGRPLYNPHIMILIQQALLRCYPIDELVMIERLELGPFSRGWLAEVKEHGQLQRWFVKQHRSKTKARLAFELQLQESLCRQGLDVIPPVIPTRDGELWFGPDHDGICFSVHPFIDADPPSDWMKSSPLSDEKRRRAGAELARFHAQCRRAASELPQGWQNQAQPWLPQLQPALDAALSKAEQQLPAADPIRQFAGSHGDKLRRELRLCLEKLQSRNFEQILIHGDYHPGNLLWRSDRIVAVLDFDYVQLGWVGYDLAYAAYMFGRDFQNQSEASLDDRSLMSFVAGYGADPESVEDFRLLPPILVGYWLLEEYVEQPPLRESTATVLMSALQDAATTVERGHPARF
jgi:Ser/Thr protein kinase RdoA (MazF antagonist)